MAEMEERKRGTPAPDRVVKIPCDKKLLALQMTDFLDKGINSLSDKLGKSEEKIVDSMLSIGYQSLDLLSEGNDEVTVSIVDGKIAVRPSPKK